VFEGPVQDLIDELGRLPGVGPKSAQRIAFHLLAADPADVSRLQDVLQKVKQGVRFCDVCGNVSERERCRYCADARRDPTIVCVVEEPKDVLAVERTREFRGRYHVLGGALDPLAGIGPDALRIRELLARLGGTGPAPDETEIVEVIIATDPNTEGEATATYLVRLLRDFPGLSVTRLASGLPTHPPEGAPDRITRPMGRCPASRGAGTAALPSSRAARPRSAATGAPERRPRSRPRSPRPR
jgi:recombination protein RecR